MEHLERQAFSFLASAVREDYAVAKEAATAIEYLLRLGGDAGIVNQANAHSILAEIKVFDSAIAESDKAANSEAIDLDGIFSKLPIPVADHSFSHQAGSVGELGVTIKNTDYQKNGENFIGNGNGNGHSVVKAAMRQAAILERIRQNGNCRLKEIQEVSPETSERTIRYDLQNLLEQGLVERIGNGGPATFYKARQ